MRKAARDKIASPPGGGPALKAPVLNPADKYAGSAGTGKDKAEELHRYGSWLMGCLPRWVQQFSVWKDELTIYIPPAGVIPVFSFLKCMALCLSLSLSAILRALSHASSDLQGVVG